MGDIVEMLKDILNQDYTQVWDLAVEVYNKTGVCNSEQTRSDHNKRTKLSLGNPLWGYSLLEKFELRKVDLF